ncbi:MAG TPA: TRAP transporter small permease [Desulfosporosinus sp.]|nr:TRAP transporter small permease [Desulfosporosinus sp.]
MKKGFDHLDNIVENIIFITTAGFVLISFLQVIFRYVLNSSLSWSEELCRYLFVWTVFLGSAVGVFQSKHVSVDIMEKIVPDKIKPYYFLLIHVIVGLFSLFLGYVGLQMAMKSMTQTSPAMQIPLGYIYLAIPIGCSLMFINAARRAVMDLKYHKELQNKSAGVI